MREGFGPGRCQRGQRLVQGQTHRTLLLAREQTFGEGWPVPGLAPRAYRGSSLAASRS